MLLISLVTCGTKMGDTEETIENKEGSGSEPDSNPPPKVDSFSGAILSGQVQTFTTNHNNQAAAVKEQLNGFSVERKNRKGDQKKRVRMVRLSNISQSSSQGALCDATISGATL